MTNDDGETRVATPEQTMEALRRYGWLRDEGDGERLHRTRETDAVTEEERCTGYYQRTCRFKAGHRCPHQPKPGTTP